jgi:hypothetical protein
VPKTVHPSTGYYTPEQWAALPRQQQDYILTQRGTKRNISMLDSDSDAYWNYNQEQVNTEDSDHYYDTEGAYQDTITDVKMEPQQETIAAISTSTTAQGEGRAGNEFGQCSRMRYMMMMQDFLECSSHHQGFTSHAQTPVVLK